LSEAETEEAAAATIEVAVAVVMAQMVAEGVRATLLS
jgi:hypothetical protein